MKKKIRNTTSFMFLLLIAACFLTHNDVYQQNNRERLNICPKTYNSKKWSAPITYYSNHNASYKLLISGDNELNSGPNSGNRVGNQEDANARAPKYICYKLYEKILSDLCVNTANS